MRLKGGTIRSLYSDDSTLLLAHLRQRSSRCSAKTVIAYGHEPDVPWPKNKRFCVIVIERYKGNHPLFGKIGYHGYVNLYNRVK